MSQENVEIVRRLYPRSFDLIDVIAEPESVWAGAEPLIHPEFEAVFLAGQVSPSTGAAIPDGSSRPTSRGIDGFLAAFGDWATAWDRYVVTPTDFIDVDENRVLVVLDIQARSKTHQVEISLENAHVLTLSDGKLARLEMFAQRDQALEAAGLRE